ncbi:putative Pentatricopeptide repeat-containing protein [Cardiosporidium cionae]|uniref:Pentatricopeptide repeat-containing protein n=1 Tax=Cardiosporidium cionae TaxID=476202 RepID=A0ABQ7JC26_9APIC|nr:putative Pentatricopeptide repeat-containing protein [Cardiosporidium cionae]|eukprot:KAF8821544.1 putative Pentatricopeptide repeat-containing protein [Cardiosporidium cionae]
MLGQRLIIILLVLVGTTKQIVGYRFGSVVKKNSKSKCKSTHTKSLQSFWQAPSLVKAPSSAFNSISTRNRGLMGNCQHFRSFLQGVASEDLSTGSVENSPEVQRSLLGIDWEQAISLLEHTEKESGVNPMTVVYNAAISSYERLGDGEMALKIYMDMLESRIAPDLITFTSVMSACEKAFMTSAVKKLFEDLHIANIHPDRTIYGIVLRAFATDGNAAEAITIFETMRKDVIVDRIDTRNYYNVIYACEKAHLIDPALSYYAEMKNKSLPVTLDLMKSLLSTCDKTERWQDALSLYNEIKSMHFHISLSIEVFNLLLSVMSKTHQLTHLQEIWQELRENHPALSPNQMSYQYCLYGYSITGDWKIAVKLLAEMLNTMDVKSITATPFIFTIQSCINCGEIQEAARILQLMQYHIKGSHPPAAYFLVMAGYASTKQWEGIASLYNEYTHTCKNGQLSEGSYPVLAAYATLAFHRLGKDHQASLLQKKVITTTSSKHSLVEKILREVS